MAIQVHFYSYQGRPNVVNKNLGSEVFPDGTSSAPYLNFVTDSLPQLNFDIELGSRIEANYCKFTVHNKELKWFVDSIEAYENIFIYHLSLDVLDTYWGDQLNKTYIVERANINDPNTSLEDTLWRVGKGIEVTERFVAQHALDDFLNQYQRNTTYCIALTVGGKADPAIRALSERPNNLDSINFELSTLYLLRYDTMHTLTDWLVDPNISDTVKLWFEDSTSFIQNLMVFPFDIQPRIGSGDSYSTNLIYAGTKSVSLGQNTVYAVFTSNVTLRLGYIEFSRPFGDFRDYPPYTRYQIWLPYIGYKDISLSEFYDDHVLNTNPVTYRTRIYIEYVVNIVDGSVVVLLYPSYQNGLQSSTFIASYTGQIGESIPIVTSNKAELRKNITKATVGLAATLVAGVFGGAGAASIASSTTSMHGESHDVTKRRYGSKQNPKIARRRDIVNDSSRTQTSSSETEYDMSYRKAMMGIYSGQTFNSAVMEATRGNINGGLTSNIYRSLPQLPFIIGYKAEAVADTAQRNQYGKLVMKQYLMSEVPTGFCKLYNPPLDMKGMQVDVYDKLYESLTSGFYIE